MAYRFNSGLGGVTCDVCNILFDTDLSHIECRELYGDEHYCTKCASEMSWLRRWFWRMRSLWRLYRLKKVTQKISKTVKNPKRRLNN